tara:strand:- start:685 stop:1116 length:432 start_codon:yes stop_codon:yes gene_type:complete
MPHHTGVSDPEKLQLEKLVKHESCTSVVCSKSMPDWERNNNLIQFEGRISKSAVPIDMEYFRVAIKVKVEPGVKIEKHAHAEPILRIFTGGEALINGEKYEVGDWILIPGGVPYEIESLEGYETIMFNGPETSVPHDHIVKKL